MPDAGRTGDEPYTRSDEGDGWLRANRNSAEGRRQDGVSPSDSSAAPALDQGLSGVAQPFTRVRSPESASLPSSEAPVSPECPVSSTACSSLAPAEATVCLQWR